MARKSCSKISAYGPFALPDEDWTKMSDSSDRKRAQNRIAQRKHREKKKNDPDSIKKIAKKQKPSSRKKRSSMGKLLFDLSIMLTSKTETSKDPTTSREIGGNIVPEHVTSNSSQMSFDKLSAPVINNPAMSYDMMPETVTSNLSQMNFDMLPAPLINDSTMSFDMVPEPVTSNLSQMSYDMFSAPVINDSTMSFDMVPEPVTSNFSQTSFDMASLNVTNLDVVSEATPAHPCNFGSAYSPLLVTPPVQSRP
ncbi:hypothetical protein K3495_g10440 [Podosphaera aphanis]|nr:hypothetical protein K3495_g10440 [Podosphaera aphanis]